MQFQADLLGIPVLRPAMVANTGRGAALLAGIGLGWWTPRDIARFASRPERMFSPRMNPSERRKLSRGWQDAVARVRTPRDGTAR